MSQNSLALRLKQAMLDKQTTNKYGEIINVPTRMNSIEPSTFASLQMMNLDGQLPAIVNTKANITERAKSESRFRKVKEPMTRKSTVSQNKNQKILPHSHSKPKSYSFSILPKQNPRLLPKSLASQCNQLLSNKLFLVPNTELAHHPRSKSIIDQQKPTIRLGLQQLIDQSNDNIFLRVQQGKILENSQYKKFILLCATYKGSSIKSQHEALLRCSNLLIRFIKQYNIVHGIIQVHKIMKICNKSKPSNYDLISLFTNKDELLKTVKAPGLQYYISSLQKGRTLAATKIQSIARMRISKHFTSKLKSLMRKVKLIQKYWRNSLFAKHSRQHLLAEMLAKLDKHKQLQQQLTKKWGIIKTSPRIEVHICSTSVQQFKRLTMSHLKQKQNSQLCRIFRAAQTDVSVIYVTPIQLSDQLKKYYDKIFLMNSIKMSDRVHFITPQNSSRIDQFAHLTTVSLLLYSSKALSRIRSIIGKQYAYIVPSSPSMQYANLSAQLNLPLLSSKQNLHKIISTKSGSQDVFNKILNITRDKCPFKLPLNLQSIFTEKQLINTLAILICRHKQIKTWYLKIDDEINSRGLAYLPVHKITFLRELSRSQSPLDEKQTIMLIVTQLTHKLPLRLKIVCKQVYPTYQTFLSHFLTRGGVIEAAPTSISLVPFSINIFIQPSGDFSLVGTYNKLESGSRSIESSLWFPSRLDINYARLARCFYKELWVARRMVGYFTIDLLYDEELKEVYALGIDCFYNAKIVSLVAASFCSRTHYDKDSNTLVNQTGSTMNYVYCPCLDLHGLTSITPFFKQCRFSNISFDMELKVGTLFLLVDQLESQQIGMLCLEKGIVKLLQTLKTVSDYLSQHHRKDKHGEGIGKLKGLISTLHRKYTKNTPRGRDNDKLEQLF